MSLRDVDSHPAAPPPPAALGSPAWSYVEGATLDDLDAAAWSLMEPQRDQFYAERQASLALDLLIRARAVPTWGYRVSTYHHCLQAATRCYRAGYGAEEIVVALFHDVALPVAPADHGPVVAEILHRYVSRTNYWLLVNHNDFVMYHCHGFGTPQDRHARDRHAGHPDYEWGVEFAARFDAPGIDPDYPTLPIGAFRPAVEEVFARTPHPERHRLD